MYALYVQVIRDEFAFLFEVVQADRISESAVERFLSATVTLMQQMLKSGSPVIPWTGLETYDPLLVDVDARQMCSLTDAVSEDDCKGWRIGGYKRPILLSCHNRMVKIVKGKIRLEVPQES